MKGKTYQQLYGDRANDILKTTRLSHIGLVGYWKGKNRPQETNIKISKKVKDNILNDKFPMPKGANFWSKAGFREDIGHHVRSSWEANYCRLLNFYDIKYEFESKRCRFDVGDLGVLIIDFYIPEKNLYIEIKGRLMDVAKLKRFVELYPYVSLKILDAESYYTLERRYRDAIPNWEKRG